MPTALRIVFAWIALSQLATVVICRFFWAADPQRDRRRSTATPLIGRYREGLRDEIARMRRAYGEATPPA